MKDHNDYFKDAILGTVSGSRKESEPTEYDAKHIQVYDKVTLRTTQDHEVSVAITAVVPGVSFDGYLMDSNHTNIPTDLDGISINKIFVRYPNGAIKS